MQIKKLCMMLLFALSLAVFFNGCGSSNKSGSLNSVATVGDTVCIQCHGGTNFDRVTGEDKVVQYQRSSPHLGDAGGCEACHGPGGQHNGVGPIPFPAPDTARCASCHNGVTTINGKIAKITTATLYETSNHFNGGYEGINTGDRCRRCHTNEGSLRASMLGITGDKAILETKMSQVNWPNGYTGITCSTCHEHGAGIRAINTQDANGNIVLWDPSAGRKANQFNLCTSCHTLYENSNNGTIGSLVASGGKIQVPIPTTPATFANISTASFYHNTSWYRQIASTHYDQPASNTAASGGTRIEGYVIRMNSDNPCFDCHGHEFKANTRQGVPGSSASVAARPTTTYTDWAKSGHAGQLLLQKYAASASEPAGATQVNAVLLAAVDETSGAAWSHYNWDDTSTRGACQRCHTSTGASNFMRSPSTYDTTGNGNSFSHLSGWNKTGGSPQQELLYCWGCHSNPSAGILYTPGARTETYAAPTTTDQSVTIAYPNIAGSNVCLTCHVGREVGDNIKNDSDADGVRSFINSHYLTAGAQLFGQSGYTYSGRSYTAPSNFKHDKIGTAAAPGTGSNGPCVGCHMTSPNKHRFTNVSTNATTGAIDKITSTTCVTCHTGTFALTPASLTTEEEEYQAALSALDAALQTKGIYFSKDHNPYFFTAAYVPYVPPAPNPNTSYTNWAAPYGVAFWKDVMGAAFNLNLLAHDPGGFAHNRYYAKRLIWDSIDFIDNGVLDNSVPTALTTNLTGQTLIDAQSYLGSSRL